MSSDPPNNPVVPEKMPPPNGSCAVGVTPVLGELGDFELRREIGRGGMGTVYEAWQRSLKRIVALKILGTHVGASPNAVMRFQREAQAAAKLHHTHIIPIYAQGEHQGVYYYAMELVDGVSLSDTIAESRTAQTADTATAAGDPGETAALNRESAEASSAETAPILPDPGNDIDPADSGVILSAPAMVSTSLEHFKTIAQHMASVADALDYAHNQGIIHRDIKPHNLMLGKDGRMRIADFGLARIAEQPAVTATGELIGSPLYMSCEQITLGSSKVDHRTDIYSLGATMYEWLTLTPPFPGETRELVINLVLSSDPPKPKTHNRAIPVDLETICLRAIEKDPDKRYQTAGEMRDDLVRFVLGESIKARRAGLFTRARKFVARHQLATIVATAAVIALALGVELINSQREVKTQTAAAEVAKQETEHVAGYVLDLLREISPETRGLAAGAEAMAPVFQNIWQSGQNLPLTGEGGEIIGPNPAAAGTPLGIALRTSHDLLEMGISSPDGRNQELSLDPEDMDLVGRLERNFIEEAANTDDTRRRHELMAKAIALNPSNPTTRHIMAWLCGEQGKYSEMLAHAEQLVRLRGNMELPYMWRGLASLLLGEAETALGDFSRAVRINGLSPWARTLRGLAMIQVGSPREASVEFDNALSLSPDLIIALLGRAAANAASERLDLAVADLSTVIRLEPTDADALAARGMHFSSLANYAEAARDFDQAMNLAGRSPAIVFQYLLARSSMRGAAASAGGDGSAPQQQHSEADTVDEDDRSSKARSQSLLDRLFGRSSKSRRRSNDRGGPPGYPHVSGRGPPLSLPGLSIPGR